MNIVLELAFLPLFVFALIAVLNALTFPRLRQADRHPATPLVSILVPMRNEAAVIAETVTSLLAQDYPSLEIILLDDQSTDGSAETALRAAHGDPRLCLLHGSPLPSGWLGKPWACHQLSERARGDFILFTDADVRWDPEAVSALVNEALQTRSDLLTVWSTQVTVTWGERLVVPLMAFSILAYLPVIAVHHIPLPAFAAAMGQCLLFCREAYQQIGGHTAIRDQIVDDMAFAYAVKGRGLRLRMADANDLIHARMYLNWSQVRGGFAKNVLAGHGDNIVLLVLSTLFHNWLFVLPWIALFTGDRAQSITSILLITLALLIRALTAAVSRQRILDALFLPVSVLLMTMIAVQSILWRIKGKTQWKGRTITSGTRQP